MHDRTSGSDELQRGKRINGRQTLGVVCANTERSHETQLLDSASIFECEKISSHYFMLDAGDILKMFVSCHEGFGGQSPLRKRRAGGSLLNPPCVIRTWNCSLVVCGFCDLCAHSISADTEGKD